GGQTVGGLGGKVDVGLVEDDDDLVGHLGEEAFELGVGDGRAGRIVRRAQQHQTRGVVDGGGQGGEVVTSVLDQIDRPLRGSAAGGEDRVHLERRPRVDRGGSGLEGDIRQRREHLGGAGAGHHFGRLDAVVGGDVVDERGRGRIGIVARNRRSGGDGLDDTRQRRQVVLVRGQVVRGQPRRT